MTLQKDKYSLLSFYNIPFDINFELTYRCNLPCVYCYIHEKIKTPLRVFIWTVHFALTSHIVIHPQTIHTN